MFLIQLLLFPFIARALGWVHGCEPRCLRLCLIVSPYFWFSVFSLYLVCSGAWAGARRYWRSTTVSLLPLPPPLWHAATSSSSGVWSPGAPTCRERCVCFPPGAEHLVVFGTTQRRRKIQLLLHRTVTRAWPHCYHLFSCPFSPLTLSPPNCACCLSVWVKFVDFLLTPGGVQHNRSSASSYPLVPLIPSTRDHLDPNR